MSKSESTALFNLIKSLSKSEKRYFKVFAAKHVIGDGNKYITVFDVMDRQQTHYDENELLKKASITKAQLRDHKKHLYKLLLQSEENYHRENTIETKIKHFILQVEILYNKGLWSQSEKLLVKAKLIAELHEKYELLLELLRWERSLLIINQQGHNLDKKLDALYNETSVVAKKLNNARDYLQLTDRIHSLSITQGENLRSDNQMQRYATIMSHPLLQDESKAISKQAKRLFYYTHAVFYRKTGDNAKCYNYRKKIVELFESSLEQIQEQPVSYLFSISNLAQTCLEILKYDELADVLKKMRHVPAMLGNRCTEDIKVKIFERSYIIELGMCLATGKFEKGLSLMDGIQKNINEFKGKMRKEFETTLYFSCAIICFIQGQYHKALVWNNKIINAPDAALMQDIYCNTRILNLLIHYELGNEDLLEHVVKSTYRYLYKKERLYKTETAILNFIRNKVPEFFTTQAGLAAFKELKTELEEITKDTYEKNALKSIDYIAWLESKIQGKGFAEVLREKSKEIEN